MKRLPTTMHIAHGENSSFGQNFHRFFITSVSVEKEPANKRRGPYARSLWAIAAKFFRIQDYRNLKSDLRS